MLILKKVLVLFAVIVASVTDLVALGLGIGLGITRDQRFFALSILAAVAVFVAAYLYHRWIVRLERETKAARMPRAVGIVRLHQVRTLAAVKPWKHPLPPLPNFRCSAGARRRVA